MDPYQQGGYPPPGGAYPPPGGPYPPPGGAYPPPGVTINLNTGQQQPYPPASNQGYPAPGGGYPAPGGAPQGAYPPAGGYPPPGQQYPPASYGPGSTAPGAGGYPPPQQGGFQPGPGGYPPPQQQGYGMPPQGGSGGNKLYIQGGLSAGRMITATVTPTGTFAINLRHAEGGDIALHFNPRLADQLVVRNTQLNGAWQQEERQQPNFPFRPGQQSTILILCEPQQFKIAVNGQHYMEYRLRTAGLHLIQFAEITGDFTYATLQLQ